MNRYQLAKLVSWAGALKTRKRLQKVAFLLQAAGSPFDDQFTLHHFGPYSSDLAELTDEMVTLELLREERAVNAAGRQYNYSLAEDTPTRLAALEQTPEGQAWARELAPYEVTARGLLNTDVSDLEIGATIVYFRRQGYDWPEAVARTCAFKGLKEQDPLVRRAEVLAREIVA